MPLKRTISLYWDFAVSLIAAVCGALWLTAAVINSVLTEVIAFFTIQAAVILPAMIFSAGLLRGQGLSLLEAERLQSALRRQMHFWVTLLSLDLIAVTLLIVGKAANWKWKIAVSGFASDIAWLLIFAVTFVSTLAILRMLPFVQGVMSLMEMNGWLVKKAIEADQKGIEPSIKSNNEIDRPEGYGKILPHVRKRKSGS